MVLMILEKVDIRINKLKYIFHVKEVEFLNYIVDLEGIKMDPKKV